MTLSWIEPNQNPWGIRLLDLRPITQGMLSTSQDPQAAANAVSYSQEDGSSFWNIEPDDRTVIDAQLSFVIDGRLQAGVLFLANQMEHKWAIFFDGATIIFVRSWQRKVLVVAKTTQKENTLIVERIMGRFTQDESPAATKALLSFLLISHCTNEITPAPLPKDWAKDTHNAGIWAFSIFGNKAQVGVFDEGFLSTTKRPLRTHTLLHIAIARGDLDKAQKLILEGYDLNCLAGDGLTPLQWSMAAGGVGAMEKLLQLGADPDGRSAEGATPLMNAAQSNRMAHAEILLAAGGQVNARDHRGFTALHRSAEKGYAELVALLLRHGADSTIDVKGHTALSLALAQGHAAIADLLR